MFLAAMAKLMDVIPITSQLVSTKMSLKLEHALVGLCCVVLATAVASPR